MKLKPETGSAETENGTVKFDELRIVNQSVNYRNKSRNHGLYIYMKTPEKVNFLHE